MIFYIAVVLYAPSIALNAITGLSTWTAVISMAVVSTFYCTLGGLRAVLWTDVFQAILMYVTVFAIIIGGTYAIGFFNVLNIANEGGRFIIFNMSTSLTERYTFWNSLVFGIYLGMTAFGSSQAEIQRILCMGKLKKGQMSVMFGILLIIIFNVICFGAGIVLYAGYHDCDPMLRKMTPLKSPDQMVPYTIVKLFADIPGLSGLCIAGIFSAALSTISSAVNSLTSVTVEDFLKLYCKHSCMKETWMTIIAKSLAIAYGGLCLLLTYIVANFRGLMEASNVLFGMVGGPILGVFSLGLFAKIANQPGTLIGLVSGFAFNCWVGFGAYIAKSKIQPLKRSTEGCSASFANATLDIFDSFKESTSPEMDNSTSVQALEEKYVFPLYKMSFLWIPVFGCLIVIIIGCIASFIISSFKIFPVVHPQKLSPFVRKLYYKSKKQLMAANSQTKLMVDMLDINPEISQDANGRIKI